MQLLHGFDDSPAWRNGFVAIGNFDGVHRGHQQIVAALTGQAVAAGKPSVVLTFDPHPIRLLRPSKAPPSLSTLERKAALLERHGVDFVIAYPTDDRLLRLSPREFFDEVVIEALSAVGLVEGPNFYFGRKRAGNVATLANFCRESGVLLTVVPAVDSEGETISSSRIRARISEGAIAEAVRLLGHPYQLQGQVSTGAGRGRGIGFPTANLKGIETLIPNDGVYAGLVRQSEVPRPAAVHIGTSPTFQDAERKVEVHLIDHHGDLYGRELEVDLLARVRDTQNFDSPDELTQQIAIDLREIRAIIDSAAGGGSR